MNDLISIIIPVYNVKPYLRRCVDAVLGQTYSNLEIILVDDGATDGSSQICDEYQKKDRRVVVLHKENGGTSSARNAGIRQAKGAYIGFLDADDWPEPGMYEWLYQTITAYPECQVAQLMSADYLVDGTMVKGPQEEGGDSYVLPRKDYLEQLLLHTGDSSFCTKLFRAEFLKQFQFTEKKLNEDFELLLQMLLSFEGIATLRQKGYNIELRPGSNTRGSYKQHLYEAMMHNAEAAYQITSKHYPELIPVAKRFVLVQSLDFLLHIPVEEMKRTNALYQQEKCRVKGSRREIAQNPYLDPQQRKNLKLLAWLPMRLLRRVHRLLMRLRTSGR